MKILVTGAAGFIGSFAAARLLDRGDEVLGVDNLNDYYDVTLKQARLERLQSRDRFRFVRLDLGDQAAVSELFATEGFARVVHLGAQAGVRYSLSAPHSYVHSNVLGTLNVLEGCRHHGVGHLVYASSSSVYGAGTHLPFSEHQPAVHPVSLYAASKRACELMAHSYSALFGLATTGLRFFTVYGPWGRPDMALFIFARAILEGQPIELFNEGHHSRDFTYIDDIIEGLVRVLDRVPMGDPSWDSDSPDSASSRAPYRVYNIGHGQPVPLTRYVDLLEEYLGRKAQRLLKPMQAGDVANTHADVADLAADVGYRPTTTVEVGVRRFVDWFKDYYHYA